MKKAWIFLIAVIASTAVVVSCTKVETTPQFKQSEAAFSATSSATSVNGAASDSLSSVITLSWNDPGFAVGLNQSKFSIVLGVTGKDFANNVGKSFSGVTGGALLGKELNGMALRLGGAVGQPIGLDVKVVASLSNNNQQKASNTIQITVTPYGDLSLAATATTVKPSAATSSQIGTTLNWSAAFNGYSGVKKYQLQYAKNGTSFASPTSFDVTAFTKSYTQLDLNKIALGYGTAAGAEGKVDFRVKATNESNAVAYSNVVTVTITPYVANNSVGIIGDATPGGWGTDTDLYRPDPTNNPGSWTVTLFLIGGKDAKFRADDDWATNWGAADFPSGTGLQNGANIHVANSGFYKVDFNAGSGAYSFTSLSAPTYTNISLIGSVVGTAWTTDVDLTKDGTDPHLWTGTYTIANDGELKFRANHDWTTSWGCSTFPSGYSATSNVPNITVKAGTYFIRFNDVSGEFFFGGTANNSNTPFGKIAVIGDATPGGWSTDTDLIQNPNNPFKWSGKVVMTGTGTYAKFRADHAWTMNWGDTAFPAGQGTKDGPNIPVTAGTYQITFNSATGEYTFTN
ncbi:MAG: SusE domain-containing protein [Bacteroidetes bacterium]|nr:SusE domain-containing protein [Bacteroidota bacterium]